MLDIDRMKRLAEELYVAAVQRSFGTEGVAALQDLIDRLIRIYRRIDPSIRTTRLVLVAPLPSKGPLELGPLLRAIPDVSLLTDEMDRECCAVLDGVNGFAMYGHSQLDLLGVSRSALVYVFQSSQEHFYIDGQVFRINNPSPSHASIFARPTFNSLRAALESYRVRVARESSCEILRGVWHDMHRLFLKAKPEPTMRKSLNQFLAHVLQDAEVKPEQNTDETHPVDIKVTWTLSDHRAIIEIKWIGASRKADGSLGTAWSDARAMAGASQLAGYLDNSAAWAAGVHTRGYLVVFDARRNALSSSRTHINASDGLYFEGEEIPYPHDYSRSRADYDAPTRFFMRPICVPGSA